MNVVIDESSFYLRISSAIASCREAVMVECARGMLLHGVS